MQPPQTHSCDVSSADEGWLSDLHSPHLQSLSFHATKEDKECNKESSRAASGKMLPPRHREWA